MANEAAAQYEKLYKQDGSIQKVINGLGEQIVLAFSQKATLGYYVGYLISAPIPFIVSKFNFNEEEREENVAKVKEMKPKRIAKWIIILLLAIGISVAFIWMETNGYAIRL